MDLSFEFSQNQNIQDPLNPLNLSIQMSLDLLPNEILPRVQRDDVVNQEELKDILDDLECPICKNIYEDPRQCINCEFHFCCACIKEWQNQGAQKKCPWCRDEGKNRKKGEAHLNLIFNYSKLKYTQCRKTLEDKLNLIKVNCHNKGCNSVVKYNEREMHLEFCDYQLHDCPNQDCIYKVTKLNEREHTEVCEYRTIKCQYCSKEDQKYKILSHEAICEQNYKQCKYCKCNFSVMNIQDHESVCEYKQFECEICKNRFFRKQLNLHTEQKCYEEFYKNLIQKKEKELFKIDKELSNKEKQINQMTQLIGDLKQQQQLQSQDVENSTLLQQIQEMNEIPKQNLLEQQQLEQTEHQLDNLDISQNCLSEDYQIEQKLNQVEATQRQYFQSFKFKEGIQQFIDWKFKQHLQCDNEQQEEELKEIEIINQKIIFDKYINNPMLYHIKCDIDKQQNILCNRNQSFTNSNKEKYQEQDSQNNCNTNKDNLQNENQQEYLYQTK